MIKDIRTHHEHGGAPEGGLVRIVTFDPFEAQGATIIHGIPGLGFVGVLSINYLLQKIPHERIGGLFSSLFSPMIQLSGSKIRYPLSLYQFKAKNDFPILALHGDVPLPESALFPLMFALRDFYEEIGISRIIALDGMTLGHRDLSKSPRSVILTRNQSIPGELAAASEEAEADKMEFVVAGIGGATLTAFDKIPAEIILAEAIPQTPDPLGALAALNRLQEHIDFEVDLEELSQQAELFKITLDQAIQQGLEQSKPTKKKEMWYA